ncbi:MAG: hypothetical protein Q8N83_09515 [Ignavibacteria bacterium]|nr:hypothetical protein [Ignavibacteria bacterium]
MDILVPSEKSSEQLRHELIDSVKILKSSIQLYDEGQKEFFKIISGQLRLLLCDTNKNKDNSLVNKVFFNFELHPLSFQIPEEKPGMTILFAMSGTLTSNSTRIFDIFDLTAAKIPLEKWLEQKIFDTTVSLRGLIKSVADKLGGAHVDSNLNETLQKTSTTFINEDTSHSIYLLEIARYIVDQLQHWINNRI